MSAAQVALVALVALLGAFLAGSIPFGVLIARRYGVNIQERGSGNIGATNVARVLGKAPAILTLVLDGAKAAAPTYLALRWHQPEGLVAGVGFAAMLGHCFSPWLRWRGGKGVACAVGIYLVMAPAFAAGAIALFALVVLATRVPALGSIAGMIAMAIALTVHGSPIYGAFAIATALLIVFTHRSNLRQLRARRG